MIQPLKFSEMPYERVDLARHEADYRALYAQIDAARDGNALVAAVQRWTDLRTHYKTMSTLIHIRYSIDTSDKAVKDEKEYLDQTEPTLAEWNTTVRRKLLAHPLRKELDKHYGSLFGTIMEVNVDTFNPSIAGELRREAKLKQDYTDLIASAKIGFRGQTYNLSGLAKFFTDADRATRRDAQAKRAEFLAANSAALDKIYDDLVQLRHAMARKLGFDTFTPLGYKRMTRTDYGPAQVAVFREEVVKHVVPLCVELRKRQARALGLDAVKFWDEKNYDPGAPPAPRGGRDFMIENTRRMYRELAHETGEFFDMLSQRELFDLENRPNKAGGGYCTALPSYKVPFIFSNFNGTRGDVEVMTHECGHAFQQWCSRNTPLLEYRGPTYEACEIHSMGMEFLTWPWMNLFFGDDDARFCRGHMVDSILFLPYGCAVDDFQHFVYANPACGPKARKEYWQQVERKYLPWRDYDGMPFYSDGGIWQTQLHIYQMPFYYIDYVLAQTCAMQVWQKAEQNRVQAFSDYLAICYPGGSQSFLQLLKTGALRNPFEPGTLAGVMRACSQWLEKN